MVGISFVSGILDAQALGVVSSADALEWINANSGFSPGRF